MTQNRSHAVMAQRAEPHDSLDWFPTPAWGTRALCEWIKPEYGSLRRWTVHEPACGQGHMVKPLREYFDHVAASDIFDYGFPNAIVADFLFAPITDVDWIITNPPFRIADQFASTALGIARIGVALLVRTAFLEGVRRHKGLFSSSPPTDILQFTERLPMVKGRVSKEATTATSYAWLVWRNNRIGTGTQFRWIPPCRKRLERADDYPVALSGDGRAD